MKINIEDLLSTSNLSPAVTEVLSKEFQVFSNIAHQYEEQALLIVVTSELQTEKIEKAKQLRVSVREKLKAMRDVHKRLKARSLREGQMIDKLHRMFRGVLEPLEEHLKLQETFIERAEEKRLSERYERRVEVATIAGLPLDKYNLHMISDEAFNGAISAQQKLNIEEQNRIDAQKKEDARIEALRVEREKKQNEENERLRKENLELQKQKAEKDLKLKLAQEKARNEARLKNNAVRREQTAKKAIVKVEAKKEEVVLSVSGQLTLARKVLTNISQSTGVSCQFCLSIRDIVNRDIKKIGGWLE